MQSGRVLYQKNMRVTAKQSWYNRTEQIRKAKRQNEIKTRLKWKQTVIYQGDHIPFLCVRNSRIFTAALGKELYYVRNYWIYRENTNIEEAPDLILGCNEFGEEGYIRTT